MAVWLTAAMLAGQPAPPPNKPVVPPLGNSSPEQARVLVQHAADYLQRFGRELAIIEFNRPRSVFNSVSEFNPNGDLYVVMFWANRGGVQLAHGRHPQMAGKDMSGVRNIEGIFVNKEIIKACNTAEGNGWVAFKWPNPASQQFAPRRVYAQKVDEYCIAAGVFVD
nr:cache domain-containing protein [Massilia sp. TS11]